MTTELPGWLTNDGTEASMLRVMTRIAGRERRIRATAPKPDPGPRVSRWRAQPPARIRYSREAWEAVYPDPAAKWWRPFPGDVQRVVSDLSAFLRRQPDIGSLTPAQVGIDLKRWAALRAEWLDAENARLDQIEDDLAYFAEHPPTGLLAYTQEEA